MNIPDRAGPWPAAAVLVDRLRAAGCVFAEDEAALLLAEAADPPTLERLVARRETGEPLEHVLGWAEFDGLRVRVTPGVFVPRRRTALLVAEAARRVRAGDVVIDLCCGSGALGLALARRRPGIELYAADLDPAAVACAAHNLRDIGGQTFLGDLFAALPAALAGRVRAVLANVPYVPSAAVATMPLEARVHEPLVALDGGPDGLDVLRRVAAQAPDWLADGGWLLTEMSPGQRPAATDLLAANGFTVTVVEDDELDGMALLARRG